MKIESYKLKAQVNGKDYTVTPFEGRQKALSVSLYDKMFCRREVEILYRWFAVSPSNHAILYEVYRNETGMCCYAILKMQFCKDGRVRYTSGDYSYSDTLVPNYKNVSNIRCTSMMCESKNIAILSL